MIIDRLRPVEAQLRAAEPSAQAKVEASTALDNLADPAMLKAISSNVAQYVTVKTFVEALRKLVVAELEPQLLHPGRELSETPPFPWSYVKVRQTEYKKLQPTLFEDLLVLKAEGSLGL